jgi:hypothetical protein
MRLTRHVFIELKAGNFQPEHAGYAQLDVIRKSSLALAPT